MPTLRSHTHLQAAQATAKPKLTNKYACPTHNDRQKSTGGNSTYPKGGVSCSKDSFVVNQIFIFQIKFCDKSSTLRVASTVSNNIN
jgi:hypothetical protein